MHSLFERLLGNFTVREEYISAVQFGLEYSYDQSTKGQKELEKTLQTQLAEVTKNIDTIEEKNFVKDEMTKEAFDKFYVRYKEQQDNIVRELQKFEGSISNPSETITALVQLCTKLNAVWASGGITLKEDLQKLIFPEGILYDKKNGAFRTPKINSLFLEIAHLASGSDENEKGTNHTFDGLSPAAERAGLPA